MIYHSYNKSNTMTEKQTEIIKSRKPKWKDKHFRIQTKEIAG